MAAPWAWECNTAVPVTSCFVYMIPYQTVSANSPCHVPEQWLTLPSEQCLGCCTPSLALGCSCTFAEVPLRAVRQGQCLGWVTLKQKLSWCHPTGMFAGPARATVVLCQLDGEEGETGPEEGQAATGRALGVQGGINQLRKCQSRTRCELRLSCCPGCARFLRHSRVLLVNLVCLPFPARMCWDLQQRWF